MIGPAEWREEIARMAARGARLACLYAAENGGGQRRLTAALELEGRLLSLSCRVEDGGAPTITDIFPAAAWDEREAHDLYGVEFAGHEPLRPLVDHVEEGRLWQTAVEGRDAHQVAVGPIHAGVIESGHFRFHVVGERILALDLRLFYKHRGIERLMEGQDVAGSMRLANSICAASSASIQLALAQCWERHLGLEPDPETRRARTILVELERLYNHLNDLGAICAGVGYSPGAMAFAALKERAQRLNAELSGHRFLFGAVAVGGSSLNLSRDQAETTRAEIEAIAVEAARNWREILFSASIQDRLRGTGRIDLEAARQLDLVGPAARASGLERDRRAVAGHGLAYNEGFRPAKLEQASGDVAARSEIRAVEIAATCALLSELLAAPLAPGAAARREQGAGGAVADRSANADAGSDAGSQPCLTAVEGPRGEIVCALEVAGDRVKRMHLRTASFRNWPALPVAVLGDIVPDFPLVNKSFELSYAAVDR